MVKYLITCRSNGTVLLENITAAAEDKHSLQLTQDEFGLLLSNPDDTAAEMTDKLWENGDKASGKAALRKTVDIAYGILGRKKYA